MTRVFPEAPEAPDVPLDADAFEADALVRASGAVLTRTEKKLLRAHLRLLAALVKAHLSCAGAVSEVVADLLASGEAVPEPLSTRHYVLSPHF